jgi:hypothetical protein
LVASCRYQAATASGNGIESGDLRSPARSLFPHVNEEHYLIVKGKTYRGVVGGPPYHLEIPELNSILFVTGNESHANVTFHVVNRQTGHDTVINAGKLHFGSDIGGPRKPGQADTDFVLATRPGEVTLASQGPEARVVIILDLLAHKIKDVTREPVKAE